MLKDCVAYYTTSTHDQTRLMDWGLEVRSKTACLLLSIDMQ